MFREKTNLKSNHFRYYVNILLHRTVWQVIDKTLDSYYKCSGNAKLVAYTFCISILDKDYIL